jgi:hypothetical protein
MSRKFISLLFALILLTTACASSDENTSKNVPAEAGQTVGSTTRKVVDTSKDVGKSVWGAMKSFGKNVKEGWKEGTDGAEASE